jgi:SAM-dependent methyltransferase
LTDSSCKQRWPLSTPTGTRGHPLFAAAYELISRRLEEEVIRDLRRWVVGDAAGRVLEIGAGTGLSFPYYRRDVELTAVEPDPYMRRRAARRAVRLGLDVEIHGAPAEALPFADASFDAVVCTLVLCTVADPGGALAEVRRVLRPDGTFRFVEHVRGEGWRGRAQDLVSPIWRLVGAGCHPNRPTVDTIRAAGFRVDRLEERPLPVPGPILAGVARPDAAAHVRPAGSASAPAGHHDRPHPHGQS